MLDNNTYGCYSIPQTGYVLVVAGMLEIRREVDGP